MAGAATKPSLRVRDPKTDLPKTTLRGLEWAPHEDLYHSVLTCTWWQFFLYVALAFLGLNALFALIYMEIPGGISSARSGSFEDAFYFSVQTLATIGYGSMAPATRAAHLLVTLEAVVGMLGVALVTGITFAKFARPTARVLFTDKLVIAPRDGVPHLMIRMANARRNMIIEAQLRVMILVETVTSEGHKLRQPIELRLVRDRSAMFTMSWTAMHVIDETSPFFGENALERLREKKGEIYMLMNGTDATFAQTVHARRAYRLDDIVRDATFADILTIHPDGSREVDFTHFHEVVPIAKGP